MNRYDRKLARAVYAMVLLAILAMVLAEGTEVYFVLACVAALISWPIAHGRTGQSAVPRWLISLAVLIALAFFISELVGGTHLVAALAHFMIFVQTCKFFETKRARDHGQLIILSMLEMIVAAILSSTVIFAVLLLAYLALGTYTLVLYHFKREMEAFEQTGRGRAARAAGSRRSLGPSAVALAGATDALAAIRPWQFWRFSASAGLFALVLGTLLFVTFPRVGEGWLGRGGMPGSRMVTGFNDSPRLGQVGPVEQSDEVAMRVTVLEGGQPIDPAASLLLRAVASSHYDSNTGIWEPPHREGHDMPVGEWQPTVLDSWHGAAVEGEREIRVEMRPIQAQYLFAPYPPIAVRSETRMTVRYSSATQTLRVTSGIPGATNYSVWAPRDPAAVIQADAPAPDRDGSKKLKDLAEQWTAGLNDDAAKAAAIERRLRGEYRYTLNLETAPDEDYRDPLEVFLFKTKAGHCQYFASAMTVLCQRVGIPARLIAGYKAVEFNGQGNYYIVRQKHAHSWVEVHLPGRGWVTFDPTPGADNDNFATTGGLLGWLNHTFDYVNYRFQQRVLNYSQGDRELLLTEAATKGAGAWQTLVRLTSRALPWIGSTLAIITALILLPWPRRWWQRRVRPKVATWLRLRARAAAGQPALGFWGDMLAILERFRIRPSAALTPREVALALAGSVPQVPGLAELGDRYYAVRYGHQELSPPQRQAVDGTLKSLAETLGAGQGKPV